MTLAPEQERALSYLHRKGTQADPESVRQRVAAALRALEDEIEPIDAETALRRPSEGRWSVLEIVDHLVESHRPAVEQLAAVVAGRPAGDPIPAGLQSPEPASRRWNVLVGDLKKVHADFLEALAQGTEETSLESRAPIVMVVKVSGDNGVARPVEWIEQLDWKAYAAGVAAHTREHQAQIRKNLQ